MMMIMSHFNINQLLRKTCLIKLVTMKEYPLKKITFDILILLL